MGLPAAVSAPRDVQPVEHELRDGVITGLGPAIPTARMSTTASAGAERCAAWRTPTSAGSSATTFTTSARHGLGRWQTDLSALVIRGLEACGVGWDVVRVSPEHQQRRAVQGGA